jgi:hypothetical protein
LKSKAETTSFADLFKYLQLAILASPPAAPNAVLGGNPPQTKLYKGHFSFPPNEHNTTQSVETALAWLYSAQTEHILIYLSLNHVSSEF